MPHEERKSEAQGAQAWALVGQLGVASVGPIVIAVLLAVYFDVAPLLFVVMILAGVAGGAIAAYCLIAPFLK